MYRIKIPFCLPISHSLAKRNYTDALLVKTEGDGGLSGYGEGTPRAYVTGESMEDCIDAAVFLASKCLAKGWEPEELLLFLTDMASQPLAKKFPSAWCAIELSILDLLGKYLTQPLWRFFSTSLQKDQFTYSAVIPMVSGSTLRSLLDRIKSQKMKFVKVKVGDPESVHGRLKETREILGPDVDIRVDANGAFTAEEALEFLEEARTYDISAIEQPVPKADIEGLKMVSGSQGVPVIVDESLCSIEDARRLIRERACHGFNIRISKCGGLINTLKIWDLARENDIFCQIGCHVGETALLSAAGRHLASLRADHAYLEGSFAHMVLKEDLSVEPVCFSFAGQARALLGPGLGVGVRNDLLERWGNLIFSKSV